MTNGDLVRAYVDAFNGANWDRLTQLFAPDAKIRGVLGWGGLDFALPIWRELHANMGMRLRVDELIVEDQKAAALLTETGTFQARFRGLPQMEPTGKSYEIVAIEWFEFDSGRILRRWGARDSAAITKQIAA